MHDADDHIDECKKAAAERKAYVDAILSSTARKKTVVAGPGTGKTFLFRAVLEGKKKCLTLTFVNALVEDLSLELYGLSDVKTLHGYALGILRNNPTVFPDLSRVIRQDAKILLGVDIDFDRIFHDRDDSNELINFYRKRRQYYGSYYGYASIVFAAVKYLEQNKGNIPIYELVLVDEFQDFNKLEVSLIDLLAEKSPVLLVGDDDQALYGFKGASPDHIRHRHSCVCAEYVSFSLPYCSRCTRVIVEAVNDIINEATNAGHLKDRVAKEFKYFPENEGNHSSNLYPKIVYSKQFARQIPWFIEKQIKKIATEIKTSFSVLIIAQFNKQCQCIIDSLHEKGFRNIKSVEHSERGDSLLLDALKVLLDESKSNLGWRMVAESLLAEDAFKTLLLHTAEDDPKPVVDLIDKSTVSEVKRVIKIMREINKGAPVEEEALDMVIGKLGMNNITIKSKALRDEMANNVLRAGHPGLRRIPIKVTTIQGSKGLSADYVFITYFDDMYCISDKDKSKISDQDICKMLVALTRAKKKVFLISTSYGARPTFLRWINPTRIEEVD